MWSRRAQEYEQKINFWANLIAMPRWVRDLHRTGDDQREQSYSERPADIEPALERSDPRSCFAV